MNVMRVAILGVAAIAAGGAAMLVRGMLGGQTSPTQASIPRPAITAEVLVAAKDITPGLKLQADLVRWQAWPKEGVLPDFISKDKQADIGKAIAGMVVRAPLVVGQPITDASVVHADAGGVLSASIKPGLRAIGVSVNAQAIAGGFILPNDRVDVVLTRELPGTTSKKLFTSETILRDVRVLAIDQTAHAEKDKDSVVGKTATLELKQDQAEILAKAEQTGVVSLSLRALGDSEGEPLANVVIAPKPVQTGAPRPGVVVFRYGVQRGASQGIVAAATADPAAEPAAVQNPVSGTTTPVSVGTP
jgi:pilus assembly protein CpaB